MCGILGTVPAVDSPTFRHALRLLAHRGPDGQGVWQDGEHAMLGHRRLAILDVTECGCQPMAYTGRYHLVYNGEIYNFLEIRRDLEAAGMTFRSSSDSEVLLAAFVHWGPDCVRRMNGIWAFAIWDSQEKRLFLSRDRMGEKPLYYFHSGDRLVFASEQKALLPFLPQVRPSANFADLAANSYTYEASEESVFAGVKRFPAAHFGWFAAGRLTKTRYWSPLENSTEAPVRYEDQVELLRDLLLDSTRLRMRADVPIGTGLSGGVDSSAVAGAIAAAAKGPGTERLPANWQNAFVAAFPGTVMDETVHAERVANHLGINVTTLPIEPGRHIGDLEHWAYLFEDIHEVNPIPHILLYRAMRERGVVVSLDGHGGDELFCGYESSILHALPDAFPGMHDVRMVLDTYRNCHPRNKQFRGLTLPKIAAYLLKSKVRRAIRTRRQIADPESLEGSLNSHLFELSFGTVLPTLLRNYDRYSMINGVEIRIPLLDHRVVDFAFSIPWSSKVRNGFTKAILRDAAAPWLPPDIIRRRDKIGFAPPIRDWMRGPMREYLLDEIESSSFRHAELINSSLVAAEIRTIINSESSSTLYETEKTWKSFGIYLWEKAFLQKQVWKAAA